MVNVTICDYSVRSLISSREIMLHACQISPPGRRGAPNDRITSNIHDAPMTHHPITHPQPHIHLYPTHPFPLPLSPHPPPCLSPSNSAPLPARAPYSSKPAPSPIPPKCPQTNTARGKATLQATPRCQGKSRRWRRRAWKRRCRMRYVCFPGPILYLLESMSLNNSRGRNMLSN